MVTYRILLQNTFPYFCGSVIPCCHSAATGDNLFGGRRPHWLSCEFQPFFSFATY